MGTKGGVFMDIQAAIKAVKAIAAVLGAVVTLVSTAAELMEDVAQAMETDN